MNTAVDIGIELKMSSKKDYTDRFDQKFDAVFDVIDLPNLSLFEIIENVKSLDFSVDPELIQIIIQKNSIIFQVNRYALVAAGGCIKNILEKKRSKRQSAL